MDRLRKPRRVVPVAAPADVGPDIAPAPVDDALPVGHAGSGDSGVLTVLVGHELRDRRGVVEGRLEDVVRERHHVVPLGERGAKLPARAVVRAGAPVFVRDELAQVRGGRVGERCGIAGQVGPAVDAHLLGGDLVDGRRSVLSSYAGGGGGRDQCVHGREQDAEIRTRPRPLIACRRLPGAARRPGRSPRSRSADPAHRPMVASVLSTSIRPITSLASTKKKAGATSRLSGAR